VVDEWHWLLDRDDPDSVAYLEAENRYTEAATVALQPLRDRLFEEYKARILETDLSVPVKRGPWWYLMRTQEGQQYPTFCRRHAADDEEGEEVLLDGNVLAGDAPYFALGTVDVNHDHTLMAYSVDFDGDEKYELHVRRLDDGHDLDDVIPDTYYGSA